MKHCSKCGITKSVSEFHKNGKGYRSHCKDCRKPKSKEYRINNLEKLRQKDKDYYRDNRETCNEKSREYNNLHSEEIKSNKRRYYSENRDDILDYHKRDETKEKRNKRLKTFYKNNPIQKVIRSLRTRLYEVLTKNNRTMKYLDCSQEFFKMWIESQFTEEMSWDNYGDWVVDHVIPIAWFDFSIERHKYFCFNWLNLAPLKKKDNEEKSDKVDKSLINLQIQKAKSLNQGYQTMIEISLWLREKPEVW